MQGMERSIKNSKNEAKIFFIHEANVAVINTSMMYNIIYLGDVNDEKFIEFSFVMHTQNTFVKNDYFQKPFPRLTI